MIESMGNFKPKLDFEIKNALRNWKEENQKNSSFINFGNPFRKLKNELKNDIDFGSHINTYQNDVDMIVKEESIHPKRNKKIRSNSYDSRESTHKESFVSSNNFEYLNDSAELILNNDVEEIRKVNNINIEHSINDIKKQFAGNDSNSYIRVATKYHLNSERLLKNKLLEHLSSYTKNFISNRYDIKKFNSLMIELCSLRSISKHQLNSYLVDLKENIIKLGFSSIIVRLVEKQLNISESVKN
jgi:hypothetical protein